MVFGKIEEGHNPKVVGSSPTRGAITDRVIDTIYQLLYRFCIGDKNKPPAMRVVPK